MRPRTSILIAYMFAVLVLAQNCIAQSNTTDSANGTHGFFIRSLIMGGGAGELGTDLGHSNWGGGLGIGLGGGYGLSDLLAVTVSYSAMPWAIDATHSGFEFHHLDAGIRISAGPATKKIRFILDTSISHRIMKSESSLGKERTATGPALVLGVGWQYIIGARLRLDWTLSASYGRWTNLKIDGLTIDHDHEGNSTGTARFAIGLSWWV